MTSKLPRRAGGGHTSCKHLVKLPGQAKQSLGTGGGGHEALESETDSEHLALPLCQVVSVWVCSAVAVDGRHRRTLPVHGCHCSSHTVHLQIFPRQSMRCSRLMVNLICSNRNTLRPQWGREDRAVFSGKCCYSCKVETATGRAAHVPRE